MNTCQEGCLGPSLLFLVDDWVGHGPLLKFLEHGQVDRATVVFNQGDHRGQVLLRQMAQDEFVGHVGGTAQERGGWQKGAGSCTMVNEVFEK